MLLLWIVIVLVVSASVSRGVRLSEERSAVLHPVHRWTVFVHRTSRRSHAPVPGTNGQPRSLCTYQAHLRANAEFMP